MLNAGFIRPLGAVWLCFGAIAALASGAAFLLADGEAGFAFAAASAPALFAGGVIWLGARRQAPRATLVDASALVFFAWAMTPAFAAAPYALLGPDGGPLAALFEAYSALTTTGAGIHAPEHLPPSLIVWRALMQFTGGFATLLFAAGVLAALDRGQPQVRKSILLTMEADNVFSNLGRTARRIGVLYSGLAILVFFALLATGASGFNAFCLALTSVSTGGFAPQSGPLAAYLPPIAIVVVCAACLTGALNIAFLHGVVTRRNEPFDPDLVGLGVIILLLTALFAFSGAGAPVFASLGEAVFAATTAGFAVSADAGFVPLAAIFAALIGGAAASTAGGLKVSRLIILWRRMAGELAVLSDPSTVTGAGARGEESGATAQIALWSYGLAFIATMAAAMIVLAGFGATFGQAWSAAAAALSNTGPLYERMGEGWLWADFDGPSRLVLIAVMVLGRLEVLAGAAALLALIRRN